MLTLLKLKKYPLNVVMSVMVGTVPGHCRPAAAA